MRCVDTSHNPRIPILMEMVGALSRANDPHQVLRAFADGFARLNGPVGYVTLSVRGLQPGEYKITRLITDRSVRSIEDSDPWRDWNTMAIHRGGFFGELIRSPYPELIHHVYLRDDPVMGDALAKFGSLIAIPLFENGEPLNWAITLREDPEGFSEQELEEAILRSNLGGATVRNVIIQQQLRVNAVKFGIASDDVGEGEGPVVGGHRHPVPLAARFERHEGQVILRTHRSLHLAVENEFERVRGKKA